MCWCRAHHRVVNEKWLGYFGWTFGWTLEQACISVDDNSRDPTNESTRFTPESREVTGENKEAECSNVYMVICLLLNLVIFMFPVWLQNGSTRNGASGSAGSAATGLCIDETLRMITTVMSCAIGKEDRGCQWASRYRVV